METKFSFALGFDVHPLVEGRPLKIGGIEIPYTLGALGHSDGDALLHALIDALLSAASLPDIGTLFPDKDPAYKNIDSTELLKKTLSLIKEKGFQVYQVDLTLILEEPKISPYYQIIKESLSQLLEIPIERIGLKARRGEGVIFQKEKPGIVAFALVVLQEAS